MVPLSEGDETLCDVNPVSLESLILTVSVVCAGLFGRVKVVSSATGGLFLYTKAKAAGDDVSESVVM